MEEMRLDELAHRSGVATTTIRLYQGKGLLPGPRLAGRTGWYDEAHLARLRLIARLQEDGHSLAGIGRLLATWEEGRDLSDLVGVEQQLDALLGTEPIVLDPAELAARLPDTAMTPATLQRAIALGLVELTDDGRFRIPDPRFLDAGAALTALGIPTEVVLDEWERLTTHTDDIAARFVGLFEQHLLPKRWKKLDAGQTAELAANLRRLHGLAGQVAAAALDSSIARVGRERLGDLAD